MALERFPDGLAPLGDGIRFRLLVRLGLVTFGHDRPR